MAPGASRAAVAVLGCSAGLLATGCGNSGSDATTVMSTSTAARPTVPAVRAATVNIASFKFVPTPITIVKGATVTWVNRDKAPHTAENSGERAPAQFDTGRLTRANKKSISFSEPGTYTYYCVFHRFMEATVIVR